MTSGAESVLSQHISAQVAGPWGQLGWALGLSCLFVQIFSAKQNVALVLVQNRLELRNKMLPSCFGGV